MLYDLVTLSISTFFLFNVNTRDKRFSRMIKILFYDGLGYFVVLTGSNIINIILYRTSDPILQSSGASLGYAVVWIMSQRILIRLREVASQFERQANRIVVARNLQSAKDVAIAIRSQFDSTSPVLDAINTSANPQLGVQVRVEQSVAVEYESRDYDCDCDRDRKPSIAWDSRS
ncbi:hypothetical protein PILCRDRAFT_342042 [Piloderma croceum F 1598]|uniref:Uncharacterized protein n=1 Tax=Piloderma croceum (strain F 1598) TaxID=765440 RepID=A0A0C3FP79_PILCF|nr:hypothetical protein PILCRDRAFT_342042 [Piloderma croceum F 1598]